MKNQLRIQKTGQYYMIVCDALFETEEEARRAVLGVDYLNESEYITEPTRTLNREANDEKL